MKKIISIILIILLIFPFMISTLSFAYENIETSNTKQIENDNIEKNNNMVKEEANIVKNENSITEEKNVNKKEENTINSEKEIEKSEEKSEKIESEVDLIEENSNTEMSNLELNQKSDKLEDGTYYIKTKLNNKLVFDISNNSGNNGAKLQLWEKSAESTDNQKFEISNIGNGYYKIIAKHSKKSLDIPGAATSNGTKVQQYDSNGTDAQQWIIKDAGDGYYYIISKCNNLYLDIAGANAQNGIQMQVYEGNGSNAQKFKFEKIEKTIGTKTIENGTYYIETKLNTNMVFDITGNSKNNGAKLQLWEKSFELTDNQKFQITYINNGYYKIEAKHSGKVLDIPGAATSNGTKIQQYDNNGTDAQQWIIKDAGDGYYYIISKCNDLYLDIAGANAQNGIQMQVYEGNGTNAQKFKFEKVEVLVGEQTLEDGAYKIKVANTNMAFDIEGVSRNNGAEAQIWEESKLLMKNQRFDIKYIGGGNYKIIAKHSEKALELSKDRTNIQQNEQNNSNAQKWIIKDNKDGTYSIINKANNLYLDLQNENIQNGSKLVTNKESKSITQKFKFEKIKTEKSEKLIEDGVYQISTAVDEGKVLDISNGNYNNKANVQIWQNSNVQQQKFEVKYKNDGYYEIKSTNSGKVLDIENNSNKNATNVQQYEENGTDYQKWIIKDAGNGYCYIISKGAEYYLDVAGGSNSNGTNIRVYDGNASNGQKFKFISTPIIDSNNYNIYTAIDNSKVLDIDTATKKTQIWSLNQASENQRFELNYIKNGEYKIISKATGEALTAENRKISLSKYDESNEKQKWKIETAKNGYFYIKSKSTELYLDIAGASSNNGTQVQLYEKNTSLAQMFNLKKVTVLYGIDVSSHNGLINWIQVKQSNKISYTMIRAAYRGFVTGRIVTDDQFERNLMQANATGLDIGVYFFTQAINENEAREEADYIINLIKRYNIKIKYPIVIDTENSGSKTNGILDNEGRADNLSVTERTNVCIAFCERIKSYGYIPMIYASRNWFYEKLDVNRLNSYEHWVAHYTEDLNKQTDYQHPYTMWQYTSSGSIPGIIGRVDMNVGYKKY